MRLASMGRGCSHLAPSIRLCIHEAVGGCCSWGEPQIEATCPLSCELLASVREEMVPPRIIQAMAVQIKMNTSGVICRINDASFEFVSPVAQQHGCRSCLHR